MLEKTWRWFGRQDKITLDMLRQIGVEGIVTALHHIPNGEVWSREDIRSMREYIEQHHMRWSVVESLPVCESIKYGGKDRDELIEKYIISLENLGREGVHTICYNFMPVLDWARTDLTHPNGDGTSSLYFSHAEFAYFDCKILKRKGAEADYTAETLEEVERMSHHFTAEDEHRLVENIIVKTQGFVNGNITEHDERPVEIFRSLLALYDSIDKEQLRANMKYFLEAIMPVCNRWEMNMCVLPTKHILDDCFLVALESVEAEIPLQLGCEIDLIYIHHAVLVFYKDKTIWLLSKFITVFFSQKGVNRRFTKRKRGARNIFGHPS